MKLYKKLSNSPENQNLYFRKVIAPWYDGIIACMIFMLLMIAVIFFSIVGFSVSRSVEEYQSYSWIPALLIFLSSFVFLSVSVRFIKRYNQ